MKKHHKFILHKITVCYSILWDLDEIPSRDIYWKKSFIFYFSPFGRAGGLHRLRYEGLAIAYYGCALQCLADESLRLVQNSGIISAARNSFFTENAHEKWVAHVFKFTIGGIEAYKRDLQNKG